MASGPETERYRPQFSLDAGLVAWAAGRTGPGDHFVSQGHAIEVGLARLHDEQEFVREACRKERVPFRPAVFWSIYRDLVEQSRPPRVGRPRKGEPPPGAESRRMLAHALVAVDLGRWIEQCVKEGHFQTAGHLAETGLRHLHALDGAERFAGVGFPFDGKQLWARYRKALAAPPQ